MRNLRPGTNQAGMKAAEFTTRKCGLGQGTPAPISAHTLKGRGSKVTLVQQVSSVSQAGKGTMV